MQAPDLTAQQAAEAALSAREAELARVQRIGRIGGFEIDLRAGQFRNRRSPEYLEVHGLPPNAAEESHEAWVRRLHPDDRERAERHFKDSVTGDARDYAAEYRVVVPGEGVRWISAVAEIERDAQGAPLRMVGVHIDITRSKQAEDALRTSEARFRAAVAAVNGIVWSCNSKGHLTGEQRGWAALTGQTLAQYEDYGWLNAVHPDDVGPTRAALTKALAQGGTFEFEHRLRCADGAMRLFSIRAVPVADADGRVREWVGVHTDITAERQVRDELRRLNDHLEARVRDEVQAREAAQVRLDQAQRMEALGQLAGGIAHDFNNVLQVIQGGASLITRRPGDAEAVLRLAGMLRDATERGSSITRRLLGFSRRGELRAEPVDAFALLSGLQEILAHTLGSAITVDVQVAAAVPSLLADKGQLETVLVNLATNARDAMPGGGTLSMLAALQQVAEGEVAELPAGRYGLLSVRDTGTGMDAETLAHATEPFFSTKEVGRGTGLGLAMARGFARQSGGALHIISAPGQGTTVQLWLPISGEAPRAAAVETAFKLRVRAHVLLAEDDPLVRATLAAELESEGYDVTVAVSGEAALARIQAGGGLDLLVSDLSMPGLDGVSLIGAAQRLRPGLPAILLTGYATEATALATSATGSAIFSLLRKPITGPELSERIAVLLETRR